MTAIYLIVTVFLIFSILLYLRLAVYCNIIDKPNERSSHTYNTVRGGGIIFPLAALLWFSIFGFQQPWAITGLLIIAGISFLDDLSPLPGKLRIIIHLIAISMLFYQLRVFDLPWYYVLLAYFFTTGWINAFNFMDGINAITPFYGLVAVVTFFYLNLNESYFNQHLMVFLAISILIFIFFNARKNALTFAGDVGSISLAFLLSWMMITLMMQTQNYEYILLFAVYGIDSVFTIIYRLHKRENIFLAHRKHLYQLLSNELKWPHVLVAGAYALAQAAINLMVVYFTQTGVMNFTVFMLLLLIFSALYLLSRELVHRSIFKAGISI